jgi:hypothetical protein
MNLHNDTDIQVWKENISKQLHPLTSSNIYDIVNICIRKDIEEKTITEFIFNYYTPANIDRKIIIEKMVSDIINKKKLKRLKEILK